MASIDLGTINARATIDLSQWNASMSQILASLDKLTGGVAKMGSSLQSGTPAIQKQAGAIQQWKANADAAAASVNKLGQSASGTARSTQSAANAALTASYAYSRMATAYGIAGRALENVGRQGVTAIAGLVKQGADFNQMLVQQRANTTLTDAGFARMTGTVKRLGVETGASLGQIATGYRHASDYGFQFAAADKIVTAAVKASVATNTDAAETSRLVARVLHEYGMSADMAARATNALWYASANSDQAMKDLVQSGGRAYAMAHVVGLNFKETSAILSLFASEGLNSREAATSLVNDLQKLLHPSAQVGEALKYIRAQTGINLAADFTTSSLATKGLSGAFDDMRAAAAAMHVHVAQLAIELFPNMRGTIGALIGTSDSGVSGLKARMDELNRIMSGESTPLTGLYKNASQQLGVQLARLNNEMTILGSEIATTVVPALIPLIAQARGAVEWFRQLPEAVRSTTVVVAAVGAAAALAAGKVFTLASAFYQMRAALIAIEAAGAAGGIAEGGGLLAALGAAGPILAAVAAVAALAGIVYLLTKREDENAGAALAAAKAHYETAAAARDNAGNVLVLMAKYDELKKKTHLTADETREMRDVLDKIRDTAPQYISGYDAQGRAIGLIGDHWRDATKAANHYADAAHMAFMQSKAQQGQQIADQLDKLKDQQAYLQGLLKTRTAIRRGDFFVPSSGPGPGAYIKGGGEYERQPGATPAELAVTAKQLQAINQQILAKRQEWRALMNPSLVAQATVKPGAQIDHLTDAMKRNVDAAKEFLSVHGQVMRITSGTDSHRGVRSAHNRGEAIDFTTQGDMAATAAKMRAAGFDASYERAGQRNANRSVATGNHIHLGLGTAGGASTPGANYDPSDPIGAKAWAKRQKEIAAEGKKTAREAAAQVKRDATEAKHNAEETANSIKDLQDKLVEATGDKHQQAMHAINRQAQEYARTDVPLALRKQYYTAAVGKLNNDELNEDAEKQAEVTRAAVDKMNAALEAAAEQREKVQELKDTLYGLLHLPEDVAVQDAWNEFSKTWTVNLDLAKSILDTKLDGIRHAWDEKMVQPIAEAMNAARASVFALTTVAPGDVSDQQMNTEIERLRADRMNRTKEEYDAEIEQADKVYRFDYQMDQLAGESYLNYLNFRLSQAKDGTDEQISLLQQIHDVEEKLQQDSTDKVKSAKTEKLGSYKEMLKEMQRSTQSILANLFENLLSGGKHKNPFDAFLQAFKQMLIRMAAEWAASKVVQAIAGLFGGPKTPAQQGGGVAGALSGIGGLAGLFGGKSGGLSGVDASSGADMGSLLGGMGGSGIAEGENSILGVLNPIQEGLSIAQAVSQLFGKGGLLSGLSKGIGGLFKGIGKIFGFADGGIVPGPVGMPVPALVHGGEMILNPAQQAGMRTGGDIHFHVDMSGAQIHSPMDVQRTVDEMLNRAQYRMRFKPAG